MATTSTEPLAGWRVLICRPQPEGDRLATRLADQGATTRCLPLLERRSVPDSPERRTLIQELDRYQHVFAVSPGAARAFVNVADDWWPQWPVQLHWYGVGKGTADVLRTAGLPVTTPDAGHTSEALLALDALQELDGDRILIAKGRGGRGLLSHALTERGGRVDEMVLYERVPIRHDDKTVRDSLVGFDPQAVVVLSVETLNNLVSLGKNTDAALWQRTLLVPAARVAEKAREAGFQTVVTPDSVDHDGIARCLRGLQNNDPTTE
ncbi:uroporphyrinogen-III synthase [Tamilnaduibacter salinus]|uniref:Uroporphyrinogen-III synthase n=1 Tax=Tamilnaduibacter salinus TaxID=1484056 RepID=A0A2U1CXN8_9GAMM|nr:uroporphyrinogen-III synthase [Tamilnaduibacter salinus]PVY76923.1 uroporphyrinogen-III synthase [Tamilnaduibacter salinus]